MAKIPEVLGVVVQVPGGAGEDAAGGEFEQNGVDDAVLIVFGLVGQARDEAVDDEGEEKMLVVDVVQREHGAAVEQELGRREAGTRNFRAGCGAEGSGFAAKAGMAARRRQARTSSRRAAVHCRDGGIWEPAWHWARISYTIDRA